LINACRQTAKLAVICQQRSTNVEYDQQTAEGAAMGMIRQRKATDQQKEFVQYLVRENKKPTEAARLAGYLHPKQSAYDLTRNPSIMLLIRQARQTLYQTDLANLAADTLRGDELASMIDRWESERAELAKDVTTAPNDEKDQ
jgi:phage terminase small subunit